MCSFRRSIMTLACKSAGLLVVERPQSFLSCSTTGLATPSFSRLRHHGQSVESDEEIYCKKRAAKGDHRASPKSVAVLPLQVSATPGTIARRSSDIVSRALQVRKIKSQKADKVARSEERLRQGMPRHTPCFIVWHLPRCSSDHLTVRSDAISTRLRRARAGYRATSRVDVCCQIHERGPISRWRLSGSGGEPG